MPDARWRRLDDVRRRSSLGNTRSRRDSNWSRRGSNHSRRGSNWSSRDRGNGVGRIRTVNCDCRVGSARVRVVAVTASVAVATIVAPTVVATAPTVATLLLLGATVGVVVKLHIMQTAPTASSHSQNKRWGTLSYLK